MSYCLSRQLKREISIQQFAVPKDAKPVAFLNRGGDPTVYFATDLASDIDAPKKAVKLLLTNAGAQTPVTAEYIGSADFSGGQVLYHAWMLPDG